MKGKTHRYQAQLSWVGRDGTDDWSYASYDRGYTVRVEGKPDLEGSADPMFRGDPARHNPEDLLVAALSGCHMLAYLALCAREGVEVLAYEDEAEGVLERVGGGGRFAHVDLRPTVTIPEGADRALAERLHETAHEQCFVASSCAMPVRCAPVIRTAAPTSPSPSPEVAGTTS